MESDPLDNSGDEFDSTYICQQESLESVNECLQAIGETPIVKPHGISLLLHMERGLVSYDGLGGTVKQLAARASLQRPYKHQIMTPRQLYEWASDNIPGIYIFCILYN